MKILGVTTQKHRRYIPIKGWDGVTAALNLFAEGYTSNARSTERVISDAIQEEKGGLAAGFFALGSLAIGSKKKSALVNEFLTEAKKALKSRPEFEHHYDYDGMGTPFFKTSVAVKWLDCRPEHDIYGLGLYAAYVGDAPEIGLAEHLGVPRTLLSATVEIEVEPVGENRFEFDFDQILGKLDEKTFNTDYKPGSIARYFASLNPDDEGGAFTFLFGNSDPDEPLVVTLCPGRIGDSRVFDRAARQWRDTWSVNGNLFCGELKRDYKSDDENAKATPTINIVVASRYEDKWNRKMPIWQPEIQQRAIVLAKQIAAALS